MIDPHVVEKPAFTIVGCEATFISALSPDANNLEVIGGLWESFVHRAKEVPHRADQAMYGLIYSRNESQRSHPDEFQYIAGVQVDQVGELPAGMVARTIPASKYVVVIHRGPIARIGETMSLLYQTWLPDSPYRHSGLADIEKYDERFHPDAEESEMEYWISVNEP